MSSITEVYLETGAKRVFAAAIEWPGWTRSGRTEDAALQALFDCAPRYARVLQATRLGFAAPASTSAFAISERLPGDVTTDFGAPGKHPTSDSRPLDDAQLERLEEILTACWQAFDAIAAGAKGKTLRKGPRGGGRDLEQIMTHVEHGQSAYISQLGRALASAEATDPRLARQITLDTLRAAAHGQIGERGPRGGLRWSPRFFVRRAAWHVLDHAWEIEDRIVVL